MWIKGKKVIVKKVIVKKVISKIILLKFRKFLNRMNKLSIPVMGKVKV